MLETVQSSPIWNLGADRLGGAWTNQRDRHRVATALNGEPGMGVNVDEVRPCTRNIVERRFAA